MNTSTDVRRRLVRLVPNPRAHAVALLLGTGALAVLIVAQADLLAVLLASGFQGHSPAPLLVAALLVVLAGRGLLWFGMDTLARRSAAVLKERLRRELLSHALRQGPVWLSGRRRGALVALTTRGLDSLDPYIAGYLPALLPALLVPLAVTVRLGVANWSSALIIVVTLPLIPVFGALVGWHTRRSTERQWAALSRLSGHFADVVAGLPTLRLFGRAQAQARMIRRTARAHRVATMRTLRIAFLSALVLELVAALSVALVAVPIGLRLLDGDLTLRVGLLVLILAPEAYLPLRALGTRFHASAEGLAVAEEAFQSLDEERTVRHQPGPVTPQADAGDRPITPIRLEGITVTYPYRDASAVADLTVTIEAGERIALMGPNGAGKSTLLALLLGLVHPDQGRVWFGAAEVSSGADWTAWRERVSWVGQRPYLFAGTLRDNIALARPEATLTEVEAAAAAAGLHDVAASLPQGYGTRLGEGGVGLSAGQCQLLALARAHLRDAPLILLDEPTAHLDSRSEAAVLMTSRQLMAGRTAVVVTHRPALLEHVTRVITMRDGRIAGDTKETAFEADRSRGQG